MQTYQKIYIEYSHEIDFDFSTGKYPSGDEADWNWEEVYIPVEHEFNGKKVPKHSYMRMKVGIDNIWSYPIFISPSKELGITAKTPITFDAVTGILSHSTQDGDRHIPKGGSRGYILSTDGNGNYTWIEGTGGGSGGDYYTKIELQTSGQSQVHWDNLVDVPAVTGLYTNLNPTPTNIGGISSGSTFLNQNMQDMWDALLYPYQSPSFTNFTMNSQNTTLEVGSSVYGGNRNFIWSTSESNNINVNSISILDITGGNIMLGTGLVNDGSETLPIGGNITKLTNTLHQWRITAINTESVTLTRNFNVNWYWRLFYGESALSVLTESDVEGLRLNSLTNSITGNYSFLANGYKYIAHEESLGTLTSFVDINTGFAVPFESHIILTITNSNSVTSNYKIYRSTYQLGSDISIAAN